MSKTGAFIKNIVAIFLILLSFPLFSLQTSEIQNLRNSFDLGKGNQTWLKGVQELIKPKSIPNALTPEETSFWQSKDPANKLKLTQDGSGVYTIGSVKDLASWLSFLFDAHGADQNSENLILLTIMRYLPLAVNQFYDSIMKPQGLDEPPFKYLYPPKDNTDILVGISIDRNDFYENFKKILATKIVAAKYQQTTWEREDVLLADIKKTVEKIFTTLPKILEKSTEIYAPPFTQYVPATATPEVVYQIYKASNLNVIFKNESKLVEIEIQFIKAKIAAMSKVDYPEFFIDKFEKGDLNQLLLTPESTALIGNENGPIYGLLTLIYLRTITGYSDEEKKILKSVIGKINNAFFKTISKIRDDNSRSGWIVDPAAFVQSKQEYYKKIIDIAGRYLRNRHSIPMTEEFQKYKSFFADWGIRKEAENVVTEMLSWMSGNTDLIKDPVFQDFFNIFDELSASSLDVDVSKIRKSFKILANNFFQNIPEVKLTAAEKAFVVGKKDLYKQQLPVLLNKFMPESAPEPLITAVPNTDQIRFEGSAFFLIPALVLIKKTAVVADKAIIEGIEKKVAQVLYQHLKDTKIFVTSPDTISGYAYDPGKFSPTSLDPIQLLTNIGKPTVMTPELHMAFLALYTMSAVAAQYLAPDASNYELINNSEASSTAIRTFLMMLGWSLTGELKASLEQLSAGDLVPLGVGFSTLYSSLFKEARTSVVALFADKNQAAKDASYKAALAALNRTADSLTVESQGHGPMTNHLGGGIFTVDKKFMDARMDILNMNDLSYALGKSLIYKLKNDAGTASVHEQKSTTLRTDFESKGWEFKVIQGESGVANKQKDDVGFVAYHPDSNMMFIIMRGSSSGADWETNFDTEKAAPDQSKLPLPGEYHRGFLNKYTSGRPSLVAALDYFRTKMQPENIANLKIIISGHSQGGALASLTAADMVLNLYKKFFADGYDNARSNQIYVWSLAGARATDAVPADAINKKLGLYNMIRQNAAHDPVPLTPLGKSPVGDDLIQKIPVLGEIYTKYTGFRSLGILAVAADFNDTVQQQLDIAIAKYTNLTTSDVKNHLAKGLNSPFELLSNVGGAAAQGSLTAATTLFAPIHQASTVNDPTGEFSPAIVNMDMPRMLYEGWLEEKLDYTLAAPVQSQPKLNVPDAGLAAKLLADLRALNTPPKPILGTIDATYVNSLITADQSAHDARLKLMANLGVLIGAPGGGKPMTLDPKIGQVIQDLLPLETTTVDDFTLRALLIFATQSSLGLYDGLADQTPDARGFKEFITDAYLPLRARTTAIINGLFPSENLTGQAKTDMDNIRAKYELALALQWRELSKDGTHNNFRKQFDKVLNEIDLFAISGTWDYNAMGPLLAAYTTFMASLPKDFNTIADAKKLMGLLKQFEMGLKGISADDFSNNRLKTETTKNLVARIKAAHPEALSWMTDQQQPPQQQPPQQQPPQQQPPQPQPQPTGAGTQPIDINTNINLKTVASFADENVELANSARLLAELKTKNPNGSLKYNVTSNAEPDTAEVQLRLSLELKKISNKQVEMQSTNPTYGLGTGLRDLVDQLRNDWPDYRFSWLITSSIDQDEDKAAKRCVDKIAAVPTLLDVLNKPRPYYAVKMVTRIAKRVQDSGQILSTRKKHYCGMIFSRPADED